MKGCEKMNNVLEIISTTLLVYLEKKTEAKCDFSGLCKELAKV